MIIPLLLAWTAITVPIPDQPGSYYTYSNDPMPSTIMDQAFGGGQSPVDVPTTTSLVDQQYVNNPMLQRGPYNFDDLQNKYPVRSVLPQSQVQTIPLQQQIALNQLKTQQMSQQAELVGQQLHNQSQQANLTWQTGVHEQETQGLQKLGDLDPTSPDYPNQRIAFVKAFPLGIQGQSLQAQLNNLDQTHRIVNNNAQIGDKLAQQDNEREINQARQLLSQNPEELAQFENVLKQSPMTNPIGIAAAIKIQGQQQNMRSQLQAYGADLKQLLVNPNDPEGDIDPVKGQLALQHFSEQDKVKQAAALKQAQEEAYTGRDLSQRDYTNLIAEKNKILARTQGAPTPEDQADLSAIQSQLDDYRKAKGISSTPAQTQAPQLPEGKVIIQNGHKFKVTNGVPTLIQ
jgi:hypothetical protein